MTETAGGKRGRLDRSVIVDAVLELARREPRSRITFKRLGEALDVDATAMYRHFRNKDELTRAALDRLRGLAADEARATTGTWRERLERHLERVVELSLQHPSIGAEGAVTDPVGPGDTSAVEFMLEMLREGGLSGDALVRAYAALEGFALAHGAAMAHEVMLSPGDSAAREGTAPWISTFGSVDLSAFPLVREHRDALLAIDGMDVVRAGLAGILDSVERSAAAPAGRAEPGE